MSNKHLHRARKEKNDEFYTGYNDIVNEIMHYPEQFKNKVVGCNCDDYRISNFVKVFHDYYHILGLAGLVATNYDNGEGAYKYTYNGETETVTRLQGDGDFRKEEVRGIMADCDIIATNPPFSLFRDFISLMTQSNTEVLAIGTKGAVGYNDIIGQFKGGTLSIGYETPNDFIQPNSDKKMNGLCRWFTSLNTKRQVSLRMTKKYDPQRYPKYDNFDAINVDRVADIPRDYYGVMGVPSTFMDYFNDKQFEIVGIANRGYTPELLTKVYENEPNAKDLNGSACILIDGQPKALSTRIFIKRILRYKVKSTHKTVKAHNRQAKKFIVIGQPNAATYNVMFQGIKCNEIATGATKYNAKMDFSVPDTYSEYKKTDSNGNKIAPVTVCWWTNLKSDKENKPLELKKLYNANDYPKYDNINAIEVSKVADIPCNYFGLMGVPPTFVDKYDPNQFEIVAKGSFYLDGEKTSQRYLIKRIKTKKKANGKEKQYKPVVCIFFGNSNYQFLYIPDFRVETAEHILRRMPIEHLFLRGSPPMLSPIKKEAA